LPREIQRFPQVVGSALAEGTKLVSITTPMITHNLPPSGVEDLAIPDVMVNSASVPEVSVLKRLHRWLGEHEIG
jgi:hypothetical protein